MPRESFPRKGEKIEWAHLEDLFERNSHPPYLLIPMEK